MALIQGNRCSKKERIKAEINAATFAHIEAYCSWAGITDMGFFIEEAAHFIFAKDKEWKQQQKRLKKDNKESV